MLVVVKAATSVHVSKKFFSDHVLFLSVNVHAFFRN